MLQNSRPFRDRALPGRGRTQAPRSHDQLHTHTRNNGLSTASQELTSSAEWRHELSQAEYPVLRNGKSGSSDYHQSHHAMWESFHPNAYAHPSESEKLEHGSLCSQTWPSSLPEGVSQSESGASQSWESALSPMAADVQSFEPLLVIDPER